MKHFIWIIAVVFFLACPGGAAAAGQPVDSRIADVTVFTSQAMVTRVATAKVEKGVNQIIIGADAPSIVGDSVTAAVFGDGEVLGVQIVRVPLPERPQEKIRELEASLDKLEKEKQALLDARKALSRQEAFLDSVVDFPKSPLAREMKPGVPATDQLDKYLLFFDQKYNAVFDRRRAVDGKVLSLDKEIERTRREIAMYAGAQEKTRTGIEVLFNSRKAQSVRIEARYRVERARWSPVYRASVGDDMKGVALAMMAEIRQATGEDWKDVTLTVSNMSPAVAGRLPELDPWWLDYRSPAPVLAKASMLMRSMEMAEKADAGAPAPPAEAVMKETALAFEYTMPMPVTIASREQETQVPVLSRTLASEFFHYTAPGRGADAYLVCEAKADRELLPGPVNVFFENRYAGRMMLEETGPGDRFALGLGVDRSVKVKREKTMDKVQETTFFGKVDRDTVIRELSYRIKAENLKTAPVTLKVTDHVPVSRTDRITVKDIEFSVAPTKRDVDGKAGVMQWDLKLAPGASTEITIKFTVTYPKDMPRPVF